MAMKLPDSFSDLYPNRFLHADQLKGKKWTLTLKDLTIETLEGEKGKQVKVLMYFVETEKQYVVPKTNGFCMKRMFGNDPNGWIGKRVTIYPTTTSFGRNTVDCIRIWGSPDIAETISITVPQGRKKPVEMKMFKIEPGECGFKGVAQITPVPAEVAETNAQPIVEAMDEAEDEGETPAPVYDFFENAPDLGELEP